MEDAWALNEIRADRELADAVQRLSGSGWRYSPAGDGLLESIARESEIGCLTPDSGRLAEVSPSIFERHPELGGVCPELVTFAVEAVTNATRREDCQGADLNRDGISPFLEGHWKEVLRGTQLAREKIEEVGALALSHGSMPLDRDELAQGIALIYPADRYREAAEELSRRAGAPFSLKFTYYDKPAAEEIELPISPILAGTCLQESTNVGFVSDRMGVAGNIFLALSPLCAAFSNSALCGVRRGQRYGNRPWLWNRGLHPQCEAGMFSMGRYFAHRDACCLLEWLMFVRNRKSLLRPEQAGKGLQEFRPWPTLRTDSGFSWAQTLRPSWGEHKSEIDFWWELRGLDAQLTPMMTFALEQLMIGVTLGYLHEGLEDANELISHRAMARAYGKILCQGPHGRGGRRPIELKWRSRSRTVEQWLREDLIEKAIFGLSREGLCSEEYAGKLFDVLVRALTQKTTGSYWVREQVRTEMISGKTEEEAARAVMLRIASIQKELPRTMTDFIGIGDLDL